MSAVEQSIALIAAGTEARRRERAAELDTLFAQVEWPRLEQTLRVRRLLPTLGPRVVDLAGERAERGFAEAVEEALTAGRHHGGFLSLVSRRVTAALAAAGIPAWPLKGAELSEAIYGDPGRRLSNDIDLLVPPEQLRAAVEVVRDLGYLPPSDRTDGSGLPQLHFALLHEGGELPPVELHWRIHWYEGEFARERLLPPGPELSGAWRPAPADQLAALLLFYARDGFIDLRLAADVGAWWDAFGDQLDPAGLDQVAGRYPRLGRVLATGVRVAQGTVGLPGGRAYAGLPRAGYRERMAIRLGNPNPHGSEAQIHAEMGLVDGLLMPRGDLRAFAVRQLLLPPLEARDGDERRGSWARLRYAGRVLVRCGVLGRYALAVARTLRPVAAIGRRKKGPDWELHQ